MGGRQSLKNLLKFVGLIFLCFISMGLMTGCSELEALRKANHRQAITVRDQLYEIDSLTAQLRKSRAFAASQKSGLYKVPIKEIRSELGNLVESISKSATLTYTDEGAVIQLPEELLFDSGFAVLKRDGDAALEKIAEYLREKSSLMMRIDGYAARDPMVKSKNQWDSNHHFSVDRALSILHYFISTESINPRRMYVAGYGPQKPQTKHQLGENSAQQGRVEFCIFQ